VPSSVTVYQYEVCPFCCKVKAFLDYNKVRVGGDAAEAPALQ
jgi:glutaredoxin